MSEEYDDDLLAVAGLNRQTGNKKRIRRAAPVASEEFSAEEDGQEHQSQRPGRKTIGAAKKRRVSTSKAEQESDSEEYGDGYGSDLMGDDADRARLAAMTELDREMELLERGDKRAAEQEKRRLAKQHRTQQHADEKAGGMRSSTRMKATNQGKKDALAELTAARSAKERRAKDSRRAKQRDEDYLSEDQSLSDSDEACSEDVSARSRSAVARSDVLDDGEMPMEEVDRRLEERSRRYGDDDARSRQLDEDQEEIEFEDAHKIQIRRQALESWVNEPFFDEAVPGCLVLLTHRQKYMIGVIVGIEHREPGSYKESGQPALDSPYKLATGTSTDVWLTLERGTSTMSFPISVVSNQPLSAQHFQEWDKQCRKDGRPLTMQSEAADITRRLKAAEKYVYTPADVQAMVEKKRQQKGNKTGNVAAEKARLMRDRDYAQQTDDREAYAEKEAALADLEAQQAGVDKSARRSMANINKRNAARNFDNALKNVSARPGEVTRTAQSGDDMFARRSTRPMTYWATNRGKSSSEAGPLAVNTAPNASKEPAASTAAEQPEPETPSTAKAGTATANEHGGWDLNIDLSRLVIPTHDQILQRKLLGPNYRPPKKDAVDLSSKRVLSLTDWKRKNGIIA